MSKEANSFLSNRLMQFAFAITYRSGKSHEIQFLWWIIEKFILLSSPLMFLLTGTSWDLAATFCSYFKVFYMNHYENRYKIDRLHIQFIKCAL